MSSPIVGMPVTPVAFPPQWGVRQNDVVAAALPPIEHEGRYRLSLDGNSAPAQIGLTPSSSGNNVVGADVEQPMPM